MLCTDFREALKDMKLFDENVIKRITELSFNSEFKRQMINIPGPEF